MHCLLFTERSLTLALSRQWDNFCRRETIRTLSMGEISTALRPFYFTVHPDLFGQFPTQRTVNENSLKQLSSILETLQQKRQIKPTTLPFYLRSKNEKDLKAGKFTLVNIQLYNWDLRETILSILNTCKLPTTFVDNIKEEQKERKSFHRGHVDLNNFEDDVYASIIMNKKVNTEPDSLKAYIDKHINEVFIKLETCRPVLAEVQRLEKVLKENLGLKNIIWDCGWNIKHYRGCLLAFKALAEHHPEVMITLTGRTLIFANNTGINIEGNIMLNSGEVRHNWLDIIRNVKKHDAILLKLPAFEKAVSRVLHDIKIGRRKFMPKVMVENYEQQLRRLTTTLLDYRSRRNYPSAWPNNLSAYEIVIETHYSDCKDKKKQISVNSVKFIDVNNSTVWGPNISDAGPLMLSPTGQFIVPASCPGFLLISFITENLVSATERLNHYNSVKHIECEVHQRVIEELGLGALHKDDSITPDMMIQCCEKLLEEKNVLTPALNGVMLWVTNYYSVMSDGLLCIPWNWKI